MNRTILKNGTASNISPLQGYAYRIKSSVIINCTLNVTLMLMSITGNSLVITFHDFALWFGCFFFFYFIVASCFIVACLLTSSFSYIRIFQIVQRHRLEIHAQNQAVQGSNAGNNLNIMQLKKSTINTFVFYILLILCYFPMFTVLVVHTILSDNWPQNLNIFSTVVFINSSINPILYCWRPKELREAVVNTARNMFCQERINLRD